ncbi:hypothetical protein ECANGB1_1212 [Enterospora canceri]|uniref:Uncharacterized protein n=1 Tax=Enterospora canceri TaxID=1081671 RepID=A0A1Y1S7B8_9MICR|nr:hypothetical protein ECANGB1_1212 [Enterospora canceri]
MKLTKSKISSVFKKAFKHHKKKPKVTGLQYDASQPLRQNTPNSESDKIYNQDLALFVNRVNTIFTLSYNKRLKGENGLEILYEMRRLCSGRSDGEILEVLNEVHFNRYFTFKEEKRAFKEINSDENEEKMLIYREMEEIETEEKSSEDSSLKSPETFTAKSCSQTLELLEKFTKKASDEFNDENAFNIDQLNDLIDKSNEIRQNRPVTTKKELADTNITQTVVKIPSTEADVDIKISPSDQEPEPISEDSTSTNIDEETESENNKVEPAASNCDVTYQNIESNKNGSIKSTEAQHVVKAVRRRSFFIQIILAFVYFIKSILSCACICKPKRMNFEKNETSRINTIRALECMAKQIEQCNFKISKSIISKKLQEAFYIREIKQFRFYQIEILFATAMKIVKEDEYFDREMLFDINTTALIDTNEAKQLVEETKNGKILIELAKIVDGAQNNNSISLREFKFIRDRIQQSIFKEVAGNDIRCDHALDEIVYCIKLG